MDGFVGRTSYDPLPTPGPEGVLSLPSVPREPHPQLRGGEWAQILPNPCPFASARAQRRVQPRGEAMRGLVRQDRRPPQESNQSDFHPSRSFARGASAPITPPHFLGRRPASAGKRAGASAAFPAARATRV